MCNAVAHAFHGTPGDVRVLQREGFMVLENFGGFLVNQAQVEDDGLLGFLVLRKSVPIQALLIGSGQRGRLQHVCQVIRDA